MTRVVRVKRITLIHAEDIVRDALTRALTRDGHQVEAIGAIPTAEDRWSSFDPEVVLADADAGTELRRIREAVADARIIALSANEVGDAGGFDAHVPRPVDMEQLRRILRD